LLEGVDGGAEAGDFASVEVLLVGVAVVEAVLAEG
jgi:hypothetical protein